MRCTFKRLQRESSNAGVDDATLVGKPSGMKRAVLKRCGNASLLPSPSPSSLPFSQIIRAVKVRFTESLDTWGGGVVRHGKSQFCCESICFPTYLLNTTTGYQANTSLYRFSFLYENGMLISLRPPTHPPTCRITPSALRCWLLFTTTTRPTDRAFSPLTDSRIAR